jgi:hypothetical protein
MTINHKSFITERKRLIDNHPFQHKFFLTYVFPPYITSFDDCSNLIGYYLPNLMSQFYNCPIDFVVSGIPYRNSKEIPHFHSIGATTKRFWGDGFRSLRALLDRGCKSYSHRTTGLVMSTQTEVANKMVELKEKHHRMMCVDYDSNLNGVSYVFPKHDIVPYNNTLFDRRRSQRKKKNNV